MKISTRGRHGAGDIINISSLVDVLFILIIFFLVATKFSDEERDVPMNLPDAPSDKTLSSSPNVAVVNVREDGSVYLGNSVVSLPDLQLAMTEAVKTNPGQKVLVRADEDARHGSVAGAVLACHRAGIAEANIGYELPQ